MFQAPRHRVRTFGFDTVETRRATGRVEGADEPTRHSAPADTQEDIGDIGQILDDTGFDPTLQRLEISESVTQDDSAPACRLMQRARTLGIRLALDDFGAGYAGWTFMQRCPVDTIKLDRSLLEPRPDASVNRERMVEAILAFARHLEVPVSIEGVERADQALTMRTLGVTTAQGFYFSHPQPPDLVGPMLAGAPLQPIA